MSFWDLSDGETAKDTGTDYEIPGGNLAPIPNESDVLAIVDEAKWTEKNGDEYLSLRWSVLEPEQYKNRKVFHKLWVTDIDPQAKDEAAGVKKRDKARRMLAAIDANAGGKLGRKDGKPSNDDLAQHLCNKPMIIKCMVWEIEDRKTGETITGNWVSAVAPKNKGVDVKDAPTAKPAQKQGTRRADLDDEIPF